ncbi:MAG: SDR family NAD(P)-dependent oxidoreductase [Clostridia bacterium]|nr:SDR family NAD(P)-dependent oxidoreductase [Clostridia bacterium]
MSKVVIITGASSGIGLATAELFLSKGYAVYGVARRPYSGGNFVCYPADICDLTAMDGVFKDVLAREGKIDVFVNNAGMGIAGAMDESSPEAVRKIVDVNLTAACILSGTAAGYMKGRGGRIINVSSVGGIMPLPYQAMYSATKAGVEVFSRALANELKPYKIKVTAVLPGDTRTGFTDARVCEGESAAARRSIEKMSHDEQHGKSPESVAKVIYRAAEKKHPPLRVAVGFVSKLEIFLSRFLSVKCLNSILYKMYG